MAEEYNPFPNNSERGGVSVGASRSYGSYGGLELSRNDLNNSAYGLNNSGYGYNDSGYY